MKTRMTSLALALTLTAIATVFAAPAAFAADPNYSNVACYFGDAGSSTWKWALKPDNNWYSVQGFWSTTQFTKTQKFFTTASQHDILTACEKARTYYNIKQPLFAAFAATSSVGNNYPIVAQGTQLFPSY